MRITAELLNRAEQRTNPLGERELVLAGLGIAAIENLGALPAHDALDCLDLSNNRLMAVENFPRWRRLSSLLLAGNRIERVDARNLSQNLPHLRALGLGHNHVTSLAQVKALGEACARLEFLDLTGNPVTRRPHYRLYAIHHGPPTLKYLDYQRIKPAERATAERWAQSAAGAALERDVVKTFVPGETVIGMEQRLFSPEEKEGIRQLLANAASVQEVEEIENAVQRGVLPPQLKALQQQQEQQQSEQEPATKRQKVE